MKLLFSSIIMVFICTQSYAQIEFRTDYIMTSSYKDVDNQKTNVKGNAKAVSGSINIPVYMKMDEQERPTMWSVAMTGSYTELDNNKGVLKNVDVSPSEIGNLSLSVSHLRPISEKWFINVSLGVGLYADHMNLVKMRGKNLMGQGNVMFIMRVRPNLSVGAGLALDNNFGYPMAYPSLFVEWNVEGKFHVKAGMTGIDAGVKLTDWFNLNLVGSVYGSLALVEREGKDMMFTHQYAVGGLQPEFRIGKSFSIPITLGVSGYRPAFYQERTIKDFFKVMGRDHDPYFSVSPYVSIALRWGF